MVTTSKHTPGTLKCMSCGCEVPFEMPDFEGLRALDAILKEWRDALPL